MPIDDRSAATEEAPARERGERGRVSRTRRVTGLVASRLLTLVAISLVTFVATNALGIDVARQALGRGITEDQAAAFEREYGLDDPLPQRYVTWLGDFAIGDWGVSPLTGRSIREDTVPRLINTFVLATGCLAVAVPVSLWLGIAMAKRAGTRLDTVFLVGTVVVAGIPWFVLGLILILFFSVRLGVTPTDSSGLAFGSGWSQVSAYVLPIATLAILVIPHISRMTRAAFRETMATPHARSAVLLGLDRRLITWRYLLPNAAGPILNVIALEVIWLLGGVIIVENVFSFPGLGQALVNGIRSGDLITVQAIAVLSGAMFIAVNLVTDLLTNFFNPRLRES